MALISDRKKGNYGDHSVYFRLEDGEGARVEDGEGAIGWRMSEWQEF